MSNVNKADGSYGRAVQISNVQMAQLLMLKAVYFMLKAIYERMGTYEGRVTEFTISAQQESVGQ